MSNIHGQADNSKAAELGHRKHISILANGEGATVPVPVL